VNFLAPHVFLRVNVLLTIVKVLVPILVIVLLFASGFDAHGVTGRRTASGAGAGFDSTMAALTGAGVIYAYIGFQGPLDFSGIIRGGGIGEAARLRWAIYGTVAGSTVLYTSLQLVFAGHVRSFHPGDPNSPYTQFAFAAGMTWLAWLIRIDALLSPAGSGLVFTFELTREVEALGRAHLTHRGLQTLRRRYIRVGGRLHEVLWLVLLVDSSISVLALVLLGASWPSLVAISSVLTLVVYAMPAVALVSLGRHFHTTGEPRFRLGLYYRLLSRASFTAVTLILYSAGFAILWKGMAALVVGSALLLTLPVLARRDVLLVGRFLRKYDADQHVHRVVRWRTDPSAGAAVVLVGYLTSLTLLSLAGKSSVAFIPEPYGSLLVCALALVSFEAVVRASVRHMAWTRPLLPLPRVSAPRD
jgi:amino acid transporter